MSTHYDDEAQVEELRRWWKENWMPLAAGLALGLAVIFGWQEYSQRRDRHRAEASQMFDQFNSAIAASQLDDAVKMADRLAHEFDDTPYAVAAALKLAQGSVQGGKLDEAYARLGWAAEHNSDAALKPLIELRLARTLWAQGKADEALKLLDHDAPAYTGLYAELRGDIKLSQGDRDGARSAYQQALEKQSDPTQAPNRDTLQRKLDDVAAPVHS